MKTWYIIYFRFFYYSFYLDMLDDWDNLNQEKTIC